tara:strand:- start:56 stop:1186 length:1131 start_codon:yes stop_codon:yes gene_type:complete
MKKLLYIFLGLSLVFGCADNNTSSNLDIIEPELYTLSISNTNGGSVDSTGGTYESGDEITITATADEDYLFQNWSGDENSVANPLIFTIYDDVSVTANFVSEDLNSFNQLSIVTQLSDLVDESSGLVFLNNNLITFNDSGGSNSLYEIDVFNGEVIRTVDIINATNNDWEDISVDSEYIYIGDFGNNYGNRQDLLIYKISISDFLNSANNSVYAEEINFSYSDQINFQSNPYNSNFDAESIISLNDSLYVFTKNWVDGKSNVYSISKNAGNYIASKIDSVDAQGLITAAEYNINSNTVTLLGYDTDSPFIIELSNFNESNFSQGLISKFPLTVPETSSIQTEGLTNIDNYYYISAEDYLGNPQVLYRISKDSLSNN